MTSNLEPAFAAMINCPACGDRVGHHRMCSSCGAKLPSVEARLPSVEVVPSQPQILMVTTADFLDGNAQALAYLASLAIRSAKGSADGELDRELQSLVDNAAKDEGLGSFAAVFAQTIRSGSPNWYPELRKLRALVLSDEHVELLALALATTNYAVMDIRSGVGERRMNAVLDALDAEVSGSDLQLRLEELIGQLTGQPSASQNWLPMAKKAAPVIATGATMIGHPWVALAIAAAVNVLPDDSPAPSDVPRDPQSLAQQLAIASLTLAVAVQASPTVVAPYLDQLPRMYVDEYRSAGPSQALEVIVRAIAWQRANGLDVTWRSPDVQGMLLPAARSLLVGLGYEVMVRGVGPNGQNSEVWMEANWQVRDNHFEGLGGAKRANLTATKR